MDAGLERKPNMKHTKAYSPLTTGWIWGFTGTQRGMSPAQRLAFRRLVAGSGFAEFHHGVCVGADAEAHDLVGVYTRYTVRVLHPPEDDKKQASLVKREGDRVEKPLPYLERNKKIVNACDILIAAPKTLTEERRSGTWATIRYASKRGVPVVILKP